MMLHISELVKQITPDQTALFLGAGASVPSGAPSGSELAKRLSMALSGTEPISTDLGEVSSILELKYGRERLVKAVRKELTGITPTGGLLGLAEFPWHSIYTTNFDRLVEDAYRNQGKELTVVRSNFDFSKTEMPGNATLLKIHGCITQDIIDGSKTKMVLTENDYAEYTDYREAVFRRLEFELTTKDILVIGQSLRDPHLRRDMTKAAELHRKRGTPGKLFALVYDEDPDRALLLESKGFIVSFGGIDEFVHSLAAARKAEPAPPAPATLLGAFLQTTVVDANHAKSLPADALRLFNGSPATYGDISNGLTFARAAEDRLISAVVERKKQFISVIGVAGVGKTTLARRVVASLATKGLEGWEHRSEFVLRAEDWISLEGRLRASGKRGVLLIDDCSEFLRQVNILSEALAKIETPALTLVLTATSTHWVARKKAVALYAHGLEERIERLVEGELNSLVNLLQQQPPIRGLVDKNFSLLSRDRQLQQLRNRCSSEMFVCLKNIFATDELDTILLREYALLDEALQEIYRTVAALEAAGVRVHRQLILRVLGIAATKVSALLELMEGIVGEYDIKPADGLYGWGTRHLVIAQTIAKYKFSDQNELFELFVGIIEGANPTISLELRMLRQICDPEWGIGRLTDDAKQIDLYERLIKLVPGERVPRHRVISKLLRMQQFESTAHALRGAEEAVGLDAPLCRYKVRLLIGRANVTGGILHEDRVAMLREAVRVASKGIKSFPDDKHSFTAYGDATIDLADKTKDKSIAEDALKVIVEAADKILDPMLFDYIKRFESRAKRL